MWFEDLMGFEERDPEQVRAQIELEGDRLRSRSNGASYGYGALSTPSLAELRAQTGVAAGAPTRLGLVMGDVQRLHADPANAGALFQAASQFNLLEMTGPSVTPEQGVGIYEHDRTQGPACAIACGAGTIYRNYFVPVGAQVGQSAAAQLDTLADMGEALGNEAGRLWRMRNGYALLTPEGRETLPSRLGDLEPPARDRLRGLLRVGLHRDVEVTLPGAGHRVSQVYCAALPISYGRGPASDWEALARLVLEGAYEATLRAAGHAEGRRVFLTLVGAGAFGNPLEWAIDALERALERTADEGLDARLVSYGQPGPQLRALIARWGARARA